MTDIANQAGHTVNQEKWAAASHCVPADDAVRDQVIGRHRDGTRLDLAGIDPKREPADPQPNLPPGSHVRKAGPRGRHEDVQIFRRGLPFMEVEEGRVRVGLNFASFSLRLTSSTPC